MTSLKRRPLIQKNGSVSSKSLPSGLQALTLESFDWEPNPFNPSSKETDWTIIDDDFYGKCGPWTEQNSLNIIEQGMKTSKPSKKPVALPRLPSQATLVTLETPSIVTGHDHMLRPLRSTKKKSSIVSKKEVMEQVRPAAPIQEDAIILQQIQQEVEKLRQAVQEKKKAPLETSSSASTMVPASPINETRKNPLSSTRSIYSASPKTCYKKKPIKKTRGPPPLPLIPTRDMASTKKDRLLISSSLRDMRRLLPMSPSEFNVSSDYSKKYSLPPSVLKKKLEDYGLFVKATQRKNPPVKAALDVSLNVRVFCKSNCNQVPMDNSYKILAEQQSLNMFMDDAAAEQELQKAKKKPTQTHVEYRPERDINAIRDIVQEFETEWKEDREAVLKKSRDPWRKQKATLNEYPSQESFETVCIQNRIEMKIKRRSVEGVSTFSSITSEPFRVSLGKPRRRLTF